MKVGKKEIIQALHKQSTDHVPVWLMRQAGRYLPEYQRLRAQAGSFMKLVLNSELAAQVTLQPVTRFGMDGAILFSDILMVPYGLGLSLEFVEGKGPVLEKITDKNLPVFEQENFFTRTAPVYGTVKIVRQEMPETTALIGFCGAPWTVACYMLGSSSDQFSSACKRAENDPEFFKNLLNLLVEASAFYLEQQIKAGAEVLQIFDSHAGLVPDKFYDDYVIAPTKKLVEKIHARFPGFPIIGFPRGSSPENIQRYVTETRVTCVSLDTGMDLPWAEKNLDAVLQGNLDPLLMIGDEKPLLEAAQNILKTFKKPFIFNLGHGLTPQAKPENVASLVEYIHAFRG